MWGPDRGLCRVQNLVLCECWVWPLMEIQSRKTRPLSLRSPLKMLLRMLLRSPLKMLLKRFLRRLL